ncbi:dTDP-glucose 4,6-dehydratase [Candidatus Peregrinibacteria bacterium]|mgnify:CR=1 FL=1|jgi:dTDP-glucose 4,6-dehydratase|nr:dTDP-glucose 4,6-dehydratase [Candidatus Peregrinibacteria bacterium]
MTLLVTGGSGFIGSNFIRHILQTYPSYKVINYDLLTYAGNQESLRDLEKHPNYKFVKGNITNIKRINQVIKSGQVTHIVNFAAESHVDRSISNPSVFMITNVVGTQVLLQAALKNKVKRFHHVSTDEVYGSLSLRTKDKFNDKSIYDPRSPYSASKAGSDHIVNAYFHTYGLPVTISNCSNNFGPYQHPEKFLPRAITNLIENKPIVIYGDGKNIRDWLHVVDHCRAIDMILHKGNLGETYLIGGQTTEISNLTIAKKLLKIFGKDKTYLEFVQDRIGHDKKYAVDWSRIKKELGWEPLHNFDEWLIQTVNWYKGNTKWWKSLKIKAENYYRA